MEPVEQTTPSSAEHTDILVEFLPVEVLNLDDWTPLPATPLNQLAVAWFYGNTGFYYS